MNSQFLKSGVSLAAFTMLALVGCGGRVEHETFMVKGKVTYEGEPLNEGIVTFEDTTNGHTGEGEIAADGFYRVRVMKGSYKVRVTPPTVEVDEGPDSPPSVGMKEMKNIPEKYRGYQSGFIVDVNGDMESGADLAMTAE